MNIKFFESIIKEHIINTYNYSSLIENLNLKSFFWHSNSDKDTNLNEEYIFIAIKGKNTDGNLFIPSAINNGYRIVISDNFTMTEAYNELYKNTYFIYVNSIQSVLTELATYGINNYLGKKIAITGSAGKTTTTYLLNNLLKNFAKVTVTDKYNSQYYLHRLMFHLFETTTDFFIGELSSDSFGMINHYGNVIKPDYSIITSIGEAHVEDFLSLENIIKEKTSLINHTIHKVFIPIEYKKLILQEDNVKNNLHKIIFVDNDFTVIKDGITTIVNFKIEYNNRVENIYIKNSQFKGDHNYSNMNLILHLLAYMGLLTTDNKNIITNTLENLNPFPGRGNIIKVNKNDFDFEIICEHHNSNPLSFAAALKNINKPTLVIMGFMHSLGEDSDTRHYELLDNMENHPCIKYILTYDKNIYKLNLGKYKKVVIKNLETHEDFTNILKTLLKQIKNEGIYSIFMKGSRSSRLELVIKDILHICNWEK